MVLFVATKELRELTTKELIGGVYSWMVSDKSIESLFGSSSFSKLADHEHVAGNPI